MTNKLILDFIRQNKDIQTRFEIDHYLLSRGYDAKSIEDVWSVVTPKQVKHSKFSFFRDNPKYIRLPLTFLFVSLLIYLGINFFSTHYFFYDVADYPGSVKITQPNIEADWNQNRISHIGCTNRDAINESRDYKFYLTNDNPVTILSYYKQQAGDTYFGGNVGNMETTDNALHNAIYTPFGPKYDSNSSVDYFTGVLILDKVAQADFIKTWFPQYQDKGNIIILFKDCSSFRG